MLTQYRTDQYDSVYEYDTGAGAYVFIGKLNGESLEAFTTHYEWQQWNDSEMAQRWIGSR